MDLCCVKLLRIFRQIAQIEHFSYAYFRVLFLACDGRRRGDPNEAPDVIIFSRDEKNISPTYISRVYIYIFFTKNILTSGVCEKGKKQLY